MRKLIHEIHRRSLWQVLGIYLGGSWLAFQVVKELAETAVLPDWVPTFGLVLLVVGFPVVMATAFVQEGVSPDPGPAASSPTAAGPAEAVSERAAVAATETELQHRLFTWRNAILGGVGAFALIGVVMGGWMVTRALGIGPAATLVARGVLQERATVILADFASTDEALARAATEAFRIDLSQSRVVRLAEPTVVRSALGRMERDPTMTLDRETATELAVREGLPAVIAGEILPAGAGYVFSAELMTAQDQEVLASHRVTADDSTGVLAAIDELSERLRERIGESVGRMRAEPPLKQVTTSSLTALQKYSQAYHALYSEGNLVRGRALLEEAVGLDSSFATAYAALGTHLANLGEERGLQVDAFERAYLHQDRLTESERYSIIALYYSIVRDEPRRAVTAWESLLEIDPESPQALANLGDKYLALRDYARAEELNRLSIELDSTNGVPYWNATEAQARLGRLDEAIATIRAFLPYSPENPFVEDVTAQIRASMGEYAAAEEIIRGVRAAQANDLFWQALTSVDLAALDAVQGRLASASTHLTDAARTNVARDLVTEALRNEAWGAFLDARVRGDERAAKARLEAALARHPLSDLPPLDRPYSELAEAFASAGDPARARRLMEEQESVTPEGVGLGGRYPQFKLSLESPDRAWGEIALAEGRGADAVEAFRRSDAGYCRLCALPGVARAYDTAGQADSARAVYERYLELPEGFRLWTGDAIYRGPVLERLGQLYDDSGDLENAAKYYARFVELWAEADEELQPRVRAAQARLEEIVRARG